MMNKNYVKVTEAKNTNFLRKHTLISGRRVSWHSDDSLAQKMHFGTFKEGDPVLWKVNDYDRKDFSYRSYKPNTSIGFYTNKICDFINIDHIVSLKDAYESGAANWSAS